MSCPLSNSATSEIDSSGKQLPAAISVLPTSGGGMPSELAIISRAGTYLRAGRGAVV